MAKVKITDEKPVHVFLKKLKLILINGREI